MKLGEARSNNPGEADGIEILVARQRLSAAADQERQTATPIMNLPDYTQVETKEEFLRLVSRLAADRDPQCWSNSSVQEFVEALGFWLEDSDSFYRNAGRSMDTSQPSWQLFADMLQAA
jgi:hypothetical protein